MQVEPHRFSQERYISSEADRRKSKRWLIEREVRYKAVNGQKDISGSGKTINISSGGVLFTTEYTLSERQSIELAVSWPAKLNGAISLQLVALCLVVRAEETQAAIAIERYEFKTCSSTAFIENEAILHRW
jgi:c-di-GMP-binding flagellar brake protein YcgR